MDHDRIATDHFLLRMFYFLTSLVGAALGITFIFKANLGVDPSNVFIDGLFKTFGISLGFWITALWLFFVVTALLLGLKPYIATIIDLLFFGAIVDFLMVINQVPSPLNYTGLFKISLSLFYLALGMLILAYAVGVYINARLGAGPTMLFTFALAKKIGRSIGLVKTMCDLVMLLVGYFLGGKVGLGTVILALGLGFLFEFFIIRIKLPGLAN